MRYLEDFFAHLEHGKGVSPHTLAAYRADLARYAASLSDQERRSPSSLRPTDLKSYVATLLEAGYQRSTVARHLASLRAYFRYLLAEGFSDHDPAATLRMPRRGKPLPRVLTRQQVERLLSCPVGESFVALRDRAVLETLYSAGLRVAELVSIDLDHLNLAAGVGRVLGKGRRERQVFLGSHAVTALRRYLPARSRRLRHRESRALFLNHCGGRLSDRSVRRILERYLVRADLPTGVTPHTLRHTFATHLLSHGAGLKEVQEMLGHKHLSTTQIYTHLSPEHLRRVYEAAHPRARGPSRAR